MQNIRVTETINKFEKQWKIKTNTSKFKIISISKKRPPQLIEISGSIINYTRTGMFLEMTTATSELTQFVNKNYRKQNRN